MKAVAGKTINDATERLVPTVPMELFYRRWPTLLEHRRIFPRKRQHLGWSRTDVQGLLPDRLVYAAVYNQKCPRQRESNILTNQRATNRCHPTFSSMSSYTAAF